MLDIKFVRENPEAVKENIRKKFQNAKLPLVDEAIALDAERRQAIADGEALKAERNKLSKANGPLFGRLKKCTDEAEKAAIQAEIDANNAAVKADAERMAQLEAKKEHAESALNKIMLVIPQMIDPSVPIGPDDSCNVEVQRFGEAVVPDSASQRRRTLRCPTTPTSWSALTASTWTPRPACPAAASTTCWAMSRGCTKQCWLTPATL